MKVTYRQPTTESLREEPVTNPRTHALGGLLAAFAIFALCSPSSAQTVLRASHQFPGGKGDVRDEMVQLIAKEAKDANVGLQIQVYPGASLFKPAPQWNALVNGQLDISLYSLDYASGMVPEFSATLMPGLIRSQERAKRINQSQFMKDIHTAIEKHNVIILSDAWFPGAMASSKACIEKPADMQGMKFRSAGPTFAAMWQAAGASIVSPPSNEIYNAFQSGVVNGTDTSLATFGSMRLYEVTKCLTAPGNNALWFMYQPVLMSKQSFDKLNKQQQDVLVKAGKDAQAYYESKAESINAKTIDLFKEHKVSVVTLTDAQYDAWVDMARKSAYAKFAKDVPDGQKLIDEALAVK